MIQSGINYCKTYSLDIYWHLCSIRWPWTQHWWDGSIRPCPSTQCITPSSVYGYCSSYSDSYGRRGMSLPRCTLCRYVRTVSTVMMCFLSTRTFIFCYFVLFVGIYNFWVTSFFLQFFSIICWELAEIFFHYYL